MVSARRVLGCIVADRGRRADIAAARMIAGVAAQAVEAARMWESGAPEAAPSTCSPACPTTAGSASGRPASWHARTHRRRRCPWAWSTSTASERSTTSRAHAAGDALLRTAARCFGDGVRTYDSVSPARAETNSGWCCRGWSLGSGRHAAVAAGAGLCRHQRRRDRVGRAWQVSRQTVPPTASSSGSPPVRSTGHSAAAAAGSSPTTRAWSRRCRRGNAPINSSATPTSAPSARWRPPTATHPPRGP